MGLERLSATEARVAGLLAHGYTATKGGGGASC
jgi:hypothetical protein